jgi:hypothetical protein
LKYIKLFEHYSGLSESIAADLIDAVSGFGTDEEALVTAIASITTPAELAQVDAELAIAKDSKYKSVKDTVEQELGVFDKVYKEAIQTKLMSMGLPNYLKDGIVAAGLSAGAKAVLKEMGSGKQVDVVGEYEPNVGDWDGMHSFQSRKSDGFGGRMNDLVNEALVKFWKEEGLNPDITKIEIQMDESGKDKWKVKWKCTIEESKDGKAWIGLTSRGGAGQPDGASGSIQRAKTQIEDKKRELKSEFSDPALETKEVLDFNHDAESGGTHVRQIFVVYTNPAKYKPYPKLSTLNA